jgi:hypothetical protein
MYYTHAHTTHKHTLYTTHVHARTHTRATLMHTLHTHTHTHMHTYHTQPHITCVHTCTHMHCAHVHTTDTLHTHMHTQHTVHYTPHTHTPSYTTHVHTRTHITDIHTHVYTHEYTCMNTWTHTHTPLEAPHWASVGLCLHQRPELLFPALPLDPPTGSRLPGPPSTLAFPG